VILEGVVTTIDRDGVTNIAPMGPRVADAMTRLWLRPYRTSTTYGNLQRTREGVFHVTDDVMLIAQTAIGDPDPSPKLQEATAVKGWILTDACRWYAFRVEQIDEEGDRACMDCRVVDRGRIRDFFGFNRAKHAVIEAAILATRTGLLPAQQIRRELGRLSVTVEKTAGEQEQAAFRLLQTFISQQIDR
jgi:hypothetical protein